MAKIQSKVSDMSELDLSKKEVFQIISINTSDDYLINGSIVYIDKGINRLDKQTLDALKENVLFKSRLEQGIYRS
mgnify:FL=1